MQRGLRDYYDRITQSIPGKTGVTWQRCAALFLVAVFVMSLAGPPLSVYAEDQLSDNANTPMRQDYPHGVKPSIAKKEAAADARPNIDGTILSSSASVPKGEALQGPVVAPKIDPHELINKRTATSTTSVNADGSLTQKNYFKPLFFKKDGQWADINTTLIEDKNAGDSGNIFGQALGEIESWFSSPTNFIVKDNDWQARFAPSDFEVGMVRIRKGDSQVGYAPVGAKVVAPVITSGKDGSQTVHYYDLWPGVNVEYIVTSDSVKENIILKDKTATNSVAFKVIGTTLEKTTSADPAAPAFTLNGALDNTFAIEPANLILNNFGLVTDQGVFSQTYKDGVITVSVDQDYLGTLPDKAFPAVIDPTTVYSNFGTRAGGNYISFKSDGYICYSNVCNLYAGSLYDSNNTLRYWRGAFYAPYDQLRNSSNVLTNATLHLLQRSNESFWTGDWDTHNFQVGHATCLNSFNCVDGIWASGNVTGSGDINVTNLYQAMVNAGDFGAWLMVMGEDGTTHSFKNFDPGNGGTSGSYVAFTYGGPPSAPSVSSPSSGQVYVDPQASFSVNPMANPNGSTPLKYEILVSTGSGAVGGLITSGLMDATQWTIPDGILQDGSTYYMQARSYDPITGSYSGWGPSVPFRIDMRTGKDKTQTYDSLGPVDVDLATGNVSMSASSHTSSALGGSLGVGLDYNSPLRSRQGLVGQYWNNNSQSGTPLLTRVDQNIDFNWGGGSPSSGTIGTDNFSTRWTGYFVAPQTGSYQFGSDVDDGCIITVNSQVVVNNWTWCGGQYGAAINLTAGQVVPIQMDYRELGGGAVARLMIKGTVSAGGMVVPATWLQTGVRSIANQKGLVGSYYGKFDGTNTFSSANAMIMKRVDPYLSFDWGTGAPMPNGPDGFLVRWTGYITVPTSGTYTFGVRSDDGAKIMLGTANTVVYNQWVDRSATESYGTGYTLAANMPTPVTIEYYDGGGAANFQFKVQGAVPQQIVPADWLSPKAQVLPDGWNLGIDPDGGLNYDHIKINQSSAVLTDSTGATHEYTWTGSGYKPPVNEDGQLVRNSDGTVTMQDTDGRTYVFNTDGTLKSVTNPTDDRAPAALQYTYASINGGPAALTQITDAVDSNRWAKVYYSGDSNCGSAPGGFDASAPAGMLCAVKTNDGRATYFYYTSSQLARIVRPGNETTDYLYEAIQNNGATIGYRINAIRDSLANDAIAAGVRADDDTAKTQLSYDILGRAISVTRPAASVGQARIQQTINYLPGAIDKSYYGATEQHITGAAEPNGFSRRVEYDNLFRTTKDTDVANLSSVSEWDGVKDLLYSTTDATGLKSTTIYDDEDRATDNYGPAPADWFGSDRKPTTDYVSQVPHTKAGYDEGLVGPAVAWYDYSRPAGSTSGNLSGAPKLHTTGINTATPGVLSYDFASPPITASASAQGIGFSATGKLRLPGGASAYTVIADTSDGVRVWIDDQVVLDSWIDSAYRTTPTSTSFTFSNNTPKRFRVDTYRRTGSTGTLNIKIQGGGFASTTDLSNYLKPDYSLSTSTKSYDSTIGDTATTTSYGSNPELGLAQSTTVDQTGLNLTTTSSYETQGAADSYLRQTAKYLPGATTALASTGTQYSYYTVTDTKDNPCTTGTTEAYRQAGFIKTKIEPDPDGAGSQTSRVSETIYDDGGRTVATRMNNDPWTCTTFDARGRITQTVVPAINGRQGRIVTTNYSYQGTPLKAQVVDSISGTTASEIDLLGRAVSATDTFGNVSTSTYDNLGRQTSKTTPAGTESYTYDAYNRVTEYKHDNTKYATIAYDAYSRVRNVIYDQTQGPSTPQTAPAPQVRSSSSGSINSSPLTLAKPSGTVDGDLLIMSASADLPAGTMFTYTVPSGWTKLLPLTRSGATSGAGVNLQVWYKLANNEPNDYTITPYSTNKLIAGSILRIDGHDPATPIDVSAFKASSSGEAQTPSVTTTFDNTRVIRIATWDNSKSLISFPSGHTQEYYVDVTDHDNWGGDKEQPTAGDSGTGQFDLSGGSPYIGFTVAIKPQQASGGPLKLEQVKRDALQRNAGAVFRFNNSLAFDETVTRSQSGVVTAYTDAYNSKSATSSYTYDKARRLIGATVDGKTYSYGYGAPTGCTGNYNPNANKNSNRTSSTVNGVTKTYCYDYADRLVSSTNSQLGTPTYDDHGNTATLAGNGTPITFTYDASDINTAIEQGANKVTYLKSATGAVLRKKEYTSGTLTKSYRYLAGGAVLQTCSLTDDNNCATVDTYLSLPGGVTLTLSPTNPDTTKRTIYSIKNFHGDTAITANELGLPTSSVYLYEPFGQPSSSTTFGTNSNPANATDQSMGWAANPTRKVAGAFTVPIIQMGARVYLPTAGRFLQVDPVEGGTLNTYVYVSDPINFNDYSGLCAYIIQCTATISYFQPAATVSSVQPTANGTTIQRASTRLQTTAVRTSAQVSPPPKLRWIDMSTIPMSPTLRAGGPQPVAKKPIFDWYNATNSAHDFYGAGRTMGGAAGCVGGVLVFPEAGPGSCAVGAGIGATWFGGIYGAVGFIGGGFDLPGADSFESWPDVPAMY